MSAPGDCEDGEVGGMNQFKPHLYSLNYITMSITSEHRLDTCIEKNIWSTELHFLQLHITTELPSVGPYLKVTTR
jgi:hypothetical protein